MSLRLGCGVPYLTFWKKWFIMWLDRLGGDMERVQAREGLVCICAECKKVIRRIDMPSVAQAQTQRPLVSHGICPECAERLYREIFHRSR